MTLILSGTDGLSDIDGSAATPAIRGTDANTGIFFPAADTIAFSEGGVEAMRITSEGLVGIGTSTPTVSLDITNVSNTGGDVVARLNATAAAGQTDADASFILDAGALVTATVTAGSFVIGTQYRIATVGTTNFTLIGATANTVGISFVATGAGTGTGTAVTLNSGESEIYFRNSSYNRAYVGWNEDGRYLTIDSNNGGNDGTIRLTADGGTGVVEIRSTNTGLTGITSRNTLRFSDSDTTTAANQPIGVIEFYSNDSTAGGTGVSAYILSAAAGTSGGGNLVFGTAPSAGSGSPVEAMRIDTSGNLQFNSGYGSVATAYGCRAWVNFNSIGTVSIYASGNCSSITDNGVGLFTFNFATNMPDVNYCVVTGPTTSDTNNNGGVMSVFLSATGTVSDPLVGSFRFVTYHAANTVLGDSKYNCLSVFR